MLSDRRVHRPLIARTYPGADQHDAVRRFAADAPALLAGGYRVREYEWRPLARSAAPSQPGVLVARYGSLSVTFEARPPREPADLEAARSVAPPGVAAELIALLLARAEGVISDDQFATMRSRLVPRP